MLFTDSCDRFWSIFLIQIVVGDEGKPFDMQRHEPIAILQSQYYITRAQPKYHKSQREAGRVIYAFDRYGHLFVGVKKPVVRAL